MYSHGQRDGPDARLGWPRGGDSTSPRTLWPCRGEHWTTWWAGWPDSLQGSPLTPGSSSCASHLHARPGAPVPCRGQEASPCGSSKRLLGGRQRADARGWGHPAGRSSVLWGGRASGVCLHPAQPASAGGGAQGWSLTDSRAPAPQAATYVPTTGGGGGWGWGSQLRPPLWLLCAFNAPLPKATWTPPAHPAAFRALVRAPAWAQPLPDLGSGVAGARLVARASRGLACSASGGTGKEVQRCAPEPG